MSAPANVSADITRAVFMLRWHAGFVLCENDCGLSARHGGSRRLTRR
jgi:hypothetical protein